MGDERFSPLHARRKLGSRVGTYTELLQRDMQEPLPGWNQNTIYKMVEGLLKGAEFVCAKTNTNLPKIKVVAVIQPDYIASYEAHGDSIVLYKETILKLARAYVPTAVIPKTKVTFADGAPSFDLGPKLLGEINGIRIMGKKLHKTEVQIRFLIDQYLKATYPEMEDAI